VPRKNSSTHLHPLEKFSRRWIWPPGCGCVFIVVECVRHWLQERDPLVPSVLNPMQCNPAAVEGYAPREGVAFVHFLCFGSETCRV
jgi:hypothetical protein